VSELVEQLRARSETLLRRADLSPNVLLSDAYRSLADLIDVMIGRHQPDSDGYCAHCVENWPCPDIKDIAGHVSAVLSGYTQTAREGR
jgi:hypothetical protein